MQKLTIGAIAAVALGAAIYGFVPSQVPQSPVRAPAAETGAPLVPAALPAAFSDNATIGQRAFDANCAACHGANAAGRQGVAPPLVHKIYEPSHHGDEAFQRAAALGARAHHWPFGDMAPVAGLTRGDVALIVTYVRELQRENGIN